MEEQYSIVETSLDGNFSQGMAGNDFTRAMLWQMNFYDVQSQIYTAITIVFERSAAGLFSGSKIEIMPFYMPLAN